MEFRKIVLLAGEGDTTDTVYHFLKQHVAVKQVIIEESVVRREFLKKRIKKLGWFSVGGQILFQLVIAKPMAMASKKRIAEILERYNLSTNEIPAAEVVRVSSVNSDECLQTLQTLQPELVIVHGTRVISKKILQQIPAIFINIHAGITPRYRGSHGAYWALVNDDAENCGVTVHLVDAGIDTGNILAQKIIPVTSRDNFITYPYLQLAEGLYLLRDVMEQLKKDTLRPAKNSLDSALWHHPTLWRYIYNRIKKKVK
jgi:methionyl-tRNA formyltransferase